METEAKLASWPGFTLPDLAGVYQGVTVVTSPDLQLEATYFDTADLCLARWGASLRHRKGEGEARWTLKLPGSVDGVRLARPELDFSGTANRVPVEARRLVTAFVRRAELVPVARLSTLRRVLELRDDEGTWLGEVDDDEVSVRDGRRVSSRFREVEVEVDGEAPPALLDAVVERLTAAGAGRAEPVSKVVRALGTQATAPPDVVPVALGSKSSAYDVVQAATAAATARLLRHDPGVRLGHEPEHVHQARVATRRLRSDLRTLRPLLDDARSESLRAELSWLADELGAVRDADVLHERLTAEAAGLDPEDAPAAENLLAGLLTERDEARTRLLTSMSSDRYLDLLEALVEASGAPVLVRKVASGTPEVPATDAVEDAGQADGASSPDLASSGPSASDAPPDGEAGAGPAPADLAEPLKDLSAAEVLPQLVRRPWRQLRRAVAELGPDPADEALHQVRIRAKRCRYAAELATPVIGRPAARLARAVADLQGVLGDFQDAHVAETWLRQASRRLQAPESFVAGELVASQRVQRAALRTQWQAAWKQTSSRKLRAWLGE